MIPVQTLLVQTLDGAIHRINHYPADTYLIGKPPAIALDSDLSGG